MWLCQNNCPKFRPCPRGLCSSPCWGCLQFLQFGARRHCHAELPSKTPLPPESQTLNLGGWNAFSDSGGARGRVARARAKKTRARTEFWTVFLTQPHYFLGWRAPSRMWNLIVFGARCGFKQGRCPACTFTRKTNPKEICAQATGCQARRG